MIRLAREALLTTSAVVGALCLLLTLLGFAFGVHPMLFRSGSMAPAISTGDIGFARTVDAGEVRKGDIVSVIAESGERVTHRVVDATGSGTNRLLTLKGDANQVIDPKVYDVASVERVFIHLPKLGYAVAWLSKAPGVYVVAAYVALLLLLIGRAAPTDGSAGSPRGGRRRATRVLTPGVAVRQPVVHGAPAPTGKPGFLPPPIFGSVLEPVLSLDVPEAPKRRPLLALAAAAAGAGLMAAALAWASPTWAAWTDSVPVTGQQLKTGVFVVPVPVAPVVTSCVRSGNSIRLTWTQAVDPTNFRIIHTNPTTEPLIAGNLRTAETVNANFNNSTGTIWIVAINGGGTSPISNKYAYSGNGGNGVCTPVP